MNLVRTRLVVLLVAATAVLVGSFGVAAAGERRDPVIVEGDCGCTGAARAKDRVERGLVHNAPDARAPRQ
jgi:hypothetical protein